MINLFTGPGNPMYPPEKRHMRQRLIFFLRTCILRTCILKFTKLAEILLLRGLLGLRPFAQTFLLDAYHDAPTASSAQPAA